MVLCRASGFSILLPKDFIRMHGLILLLLGRTGSVFAGMGINIHSDSVIRHLRKPGDTRHYLPQKGMYRYVTSGNYFGELLNG